MVRDAQSAFERSAHDARVAEKRSEDHLELHRIG
jgi:hypothetical protein